VSAHFVNSVVAVYEHLQSQNFHETLTFLHAIFPNAATNTLQSTKKEGEIKGIGGDWFFCCCQLLTAKLVDRGRRRVIF
jgi:hypothetical protein